MQHSHSVAVLPPRVMASQLVVSHALKAAAYRFVQYPEIITRQRGIHRGAGLLGHGELQGRSPDVAIKLPVVCAGLGWQVDDPPNPCRVTDRPGDDANHIGL